ncbi:MAG: AAA family ATPase [Phycisphaerales bacterium]|nr:AAA family ATPase [Phycisphaerales bacterium]
MISSFHIQHYKGFEDFKVEHLKRLNLITGKNNVGKTSLLEVIFNCYNLNDHIPFFREQSWRTFLINIQPQLQNSTTVETLTDIWKSHFFNFETDKNITFTINYAEEEKQDKLSLQYSSNLHNSDMDSLLFTITRQGLMKHQTINYTINYSIEKNYINQGQSIQNKKNITPINFNEDECKNFLEFPFTFYSSAKFLTNYTKNLEDIFRNNKEKELIDKMKLIEPRLTDIALINNKILVGIGLNKKIDFYNLGDGFVRYFSIVLELLTIAKGGILLIDEIETGLHHSLYESVLQNILNIAQEKQIQVFVTTHSAELAESFKEVYKKNKNYLSFNQLIYNERTKKIDNIHSDAEMLEYKIEHNKAYRGE